MAVAPFPGSLTAPDEPDPSEEPPEVLADDWLPESVVAVVVAVTVAVAVVVARIVTVAGAALGDAVTVARTVAVAVAVTVGRARTSALALSTSLWLPAVASPDPSMNTAMPPSHTRLRRRSGLASGCLGGRAVGWCGGGGYDMAAPRIVEC